MNRSYYANRTRYVFNRFCTVACGPVAEHTITVDFDDGAQRIFRRIITQPIRSWKAQPPAPPTPTTNRPRAHERSGHRSDGAVCGSAPSASRVLRIADATACGGPGPWSLCRPCARITTGQATACPHAPPELTPNPDDRGPQPPTFSSPLSSISWDQTVVEVRRTLWGVARDGARLAAPLPPGGPEVS
jgi:hypothetical protein